MKRSPSIGKRAYHLRRLLGLRWADIAERLGYRAELPREVRGEKIVLAARKYALRAGETWPLPRTAKETATDA